jgi:hypothetical protein
VAQLEEQLVEQLVVQDQQLLWEVLPVEQQEELVEQQEVLPEELQQEAQDQL